MNNITLPVEDVEVCLILYNEEMLIGDCLKALKPYFDRVTVLDMGSTDRTVEVVRDIYGDEATILSQPRADLFRKGFAHARNKATAGARKPWVLHIDADEILAPLSQGALIFPAPSEIAAARVHRRNLVGDAPETIIPDALAAYDTRSLEQHVRLYRKAPSARWESFLHEELWIGDDRVHDHVGTAPLTLEHISGFRPVPSLWEKEEFYAWILMRVYDRPELQHNMREFYTKEFIPTHEAKFRGMASNFAHRHQLENF